MYLNNRGCRGPGRIKSPAYRNFERLVFAWKLQHVEDIAQAEIVTRGEGWIEVDVVFAFPPAKILTKDGRPKRHDVDNRLKALNDAVSEIVGFNDCRIVKQTIEKRQTASPTAYVDVTITSGSLNVALFNVGHDAQDQ
jgi:Holliday junction resolvase RusA-like endonuclease